MTTFRNLTFSKFLLASFTALALTGCLPVPIYDVTPSTARAGTELTFDASGSVVSHFGPPTAPSRTASAARQAASTSSVSAVPWASMLAPPNSCSS